MPSFLKCGLAASLALGLSTPARAADVRRETFGQTKSGAPVARTVLRNDLGMTVAAIDFGATLTTITAPDRAGQFRNMVLSLPTVAAYEKSQRRWASVIGRYAGRITEARITIDGKTYPLEASGRGNMTLHGGFESYDKRLWSSRTLSDRKSIAVLFAYRSQDGDQGFPGTLDMSVTYRLMRKSNALRIEYVARTSAPTVVNLTNHGFLNLAGAGSGTIVDHQVWMDVDRYAEVDARKAPSGRLMPVDGSVLDFRQPRRLGDAMRLDDPLLASSQGFDHSLVLRAKRPGLRLAARIEDPGSGRRVSILTTESSVQFNSGNGFDGTEVGPDGVAYAKYAGFAFETQHLPDSPNQPDFPSTALRPGQTFRSVTVLRFSLDR
jgi:aldose 1-epimerase